MRINRVRNTAPHGIEVPFSTLVDYLATTSKQEAFARHSIIVRSPEFDTLLTATRFLTNPDNGENS